MKSYLVTWEIDIDADSPKEAAEQAYSIQSDGDGYACVFDVKEHGSEDVVHVDLLNCP